MHKTTQLSSLRAVCRSRLFQFALCWLAGLCLGTLLALSAGSSSFSVMRLAASSRVSIVYSLCCVFLPFLLAAYAVYIHRFALLIFLCFCKAISFSFCALLAVRAFGTAGWLVQPMLQFTDTCLVPVLCWFCIRSISGSSTSVRKDLILSLIIGAAAVSMDYFLVSPFLAELIHF